MRLSLKSLVVPIVFALLVFVALQTEKGALRDRGVVRVKEHSTREKVVIFSWADAVEAPMAMQFRDAFAQWRERTDTIIIDLNSPGGSLREGQKVIEIIEGMKKTHRVETRVRGRRYCLSMCVPIYLQGDLRRASPSSRWMFHEPKLVDAFTDKIQEQPDFEQNWSSNRFFDRYFVNSEMDADWRERLRDQWVGEDVWFTGKELVEQHSGVVQELM